MCASRGFMMTLHLRSTLPSFPSPPPRRGWQRSEHCPQCFALRITRQHVWVGTPGHHGARSGSLSPSSILLHEPYEVPRMYVRSPPGHSKQRRGPQSTDARTEKTPALWPVRSTAMSGKSVLWCSRNNKAVPFGCATKSGIPAERWSSLYLRRERKP